MSRNWYRHKVVNTADLATPSDVERELSLLGSAGYHVVATYGACLVMERYVNADEEIMEPRRDTDGGRA